MEHTRFLRTSDGTVYGWTENGQVWLNREAKLREYVAKAHKKGLLEYASSVTLVQKIRRFLAR